jgi:hypothetical protein
MRTFAVSAESALDSPTGRPGLIASPVLVWVALFANVLAFSGLPTVVPIPGTAAQLFTQGALVAAVIFVLLANPGGVIRPNLFLVLLTMLAVVGLMVSIHNEFILGSAFRASRVLAFIAVLWFLTPWWGRSDFVLLRAHLLCLRVVIGTVLLGAVIAPGVAFSYGGRLQGAIWPIPPTQVAHYAAILLGCTSVLWFARAVSSRTALITLAGAGFALVGAHTRTALLAMTIGLAVAGASMFLGHARVRRASAMLSVIAVIVAAIFAPLIVSWGLRGQSFEEASQLTGRTKVWSSILGQQRPWLEQVFGSGLSNKSFNGLPIDSNWLAVFLDQGWFGVIIDAALIIILILLAATHQRGLRRALALFLVTYCLVASFTETGLAEATPYLLELVIAASLLAAPASRGSGVPT